MRSLLALILTALLCATSATAADSSAPSAAPAPPPAPAQNQIEPGDLVNLVHAARLGLGGLPSHDLVLVSTSIERIEATLGKIQAASAAGPALPPAPTPAPAAAAKKD